jgi:hypothetical protein
VKPIRVQLSRAKGWRMPPNTVKVDRTTKWGNPFVVGPHGKAKDCVKYFALGLCGYDVLGLKTGDGKWTIDVMHDYRKTVKRDIYRLRDKNLACWCRPGAPCHADILLQIAADQHKPRSRRKKLDITPYE